MVVVVAGDHAEWRSSGGNDVGKRVGKLVCQPNANLIPKVQTKSQQAHFGLGPRRETDRPLMDVGHRIHGLNPDPGSGPPSGIPSTLDVLTSPPWRPSIERGGDITPPLSQLIN